MPYSTSFLEQDDGTTPPWLGTDNLGQTTADKRIVTGNITLYLALACYKKCIIDPKNYSFSLTFHCI